MVKKIDLTKVKEDVNLILFDYFGCGIDELKFSNSIINSVEDYANETL